MLAEKERWEEEQEQREEKGELDPVVETLATLVEYRSEPVIMLDAEIKGQRLEAMFDPGATMDFIDERVVQRLGLKKERTTPNRITVANGGVETIEWVVNVSVQFKGYKENMTLIVFPKLSHNIILGRPWTKRRQPQVDWIEDRITVDINGRRITVTGRKALESTGSEGIHLMEGKKIVRAAKKGCPTFLVTVMEKELVGRLPKELKEF
jgi:hypothetical protein